MNDKARKWLEAHADLLEPEELLTEKGKQRLFDGSWPEPFEVEDMGPFIEIKDSNSFNKIVGNPNNWPVILSRPDLFESWIIPQASLLFGKIWFDRVKHQKSISRGIPFPLFTEEERSVKDLDYSPHGKAKIARIVEKISVVLRTYLEGKWYSGETRDASGYVIDSLKNEFIREVGTDMGYKLKGVLACPLCLASSPPIKIPLNNETGKIYSCPRCVSILENISIKTISDQNVKKFIKEKEKRKIFKRFLGITCICPNDDCKGKFVPISCSSGLEEAKGALKNFAVGKNIQIFHQPPQKMLDFPLTCPFCETNFTPRKALKAESGFKNKSGFLTGLPSTKIWVKREDITLDAQDKDNKYSLKDKIASPCMSDDRIIAKQRLNLIMGEIIITMSKLNTKTVSGLITWYFFISVMYWIMKHSRDANNYFFNFIIKERTPTENEQVISSLKRKMTLNTRGRETVIHQSIFHKWMDLLEKNIKKFTKINSKIKSLKDFPWFAKAPSFSGGPETKFYSVVDNNKIKNESPVRRRKSKIKPRLARIYSIKKEGVEHISDMKMCEWQAIKLKRNASLQTGDKVMVRGLIMSGHPTHAPIQRILRLRSVLLKNIIDRIILEEKTGKSDIGFWKAWRKRVIQARKSTGIKISL